MLAGAALAAAGEMAGRELKLPKKIRVAILGFDGHVGEITEPLPHLPDVEVTAICDRSPTALKRATRNARPAPARQ